MASDNFISADQFRQLLGVSRLLAVTTELDPLLVRLAEAATDLLGCERASIFVHDAAAGQLWTTVALKAGRPIRVPVNRGIVGVAFRENKIINCAEAYKDLRFDPASDQASGFVTRSLLAAPMADLSGKPLGVLQAINKLNGPFTARDEMLVQLLSDQAGVAIQRYRLQAAAVESTALRREFELARRVQDKITPKAAPVNPRALGKDEIISLLQGGVPSSHVEELVKDRGVKFAPTPADLNDIRTSGGTEDLIQAIQQASMAGK